MTKQSKLFSQIAALSNIAFLLVAPVLGLLLLGLWLDKLLHSSPLFLITGVIVGFIASIINTFRIVSLLNKPE